MKYWSGDDIQYRKYKEGYSILPYKYPACSLKSMYNRIEVEIVPGKMAEQMIINPSTFNQINCMCFEMERRSTSLVNGITTTDTFWIPIEDMGYTEEPKPYGNFEYAMQLL